jgi:AraC-like DNA-binding protein
MDTCDMDSASPADSAERAHDTRELARRALELMEEAPDRPISIGDLALALGVDRFRLHRAFVRCHGVPPHRYDLTRRVRLAADMLAQGTLVSTAARATGFQTLTYFSRRFKAVLGVSPSDYKRDLRRRARSLAS